MVFCDLGGYTAWNEEEEPEDVVAVMDRIKREAIRVFEAHGGIANQFVGDEVVGLFGVTKSHEDDPSRAVLAARALHDFVREQVALRANGKARPLLMHTGIETGLVYVQACVPRGGLYEVTGDPVNLAARLRSLAESDEILVGPETRNRIAPFFELEQLEPQQVRGKAQAVSACRVVRPSSSTSFFDAARQRGLTPYVGRDRELDQLELAWQEACSGRGSLVSIAGAPGIGKTRLLYEFRKRVRALVQTSGGAFVLQGRCPAYGEVAPYQPFIDAIRGGLQGDFERSAPQDPMEPIRAAGPALEPHMPALSYLVEGTKSPHALPSEEASGERLRDAIVAGLVQLIAVGSKRRPLLLVLEDWHWADEASRAALRQIAQELPQLCVLIIVSYRPLELAEQARPHVGTALGLDPLDAAQTEALACRVLDTLELPRGINQFVHDRTLGNPFFAEEVCRSLLESGVLARGGGTLILTQRLSELRAPATVQAIVRARADRLPGPHKDVLRMASVLGTEFSLELLGALHDSARASAVAATESLTSILDELSVQGLVYPVTSASAPLYRFRHAITQRVVYETLPLDDRRRHHTQLAETLEARLSRDELESHCESLAHHYGLSQNTSKGVEYAVLAGDKAWRSLSLEQAERQYRRAIELLDKQRLHADQAAACRKRVEISVKWARVGVYNPSADQVQALRVSCEWAERIGDVRGQCMCLNWMGWIDFACGNQPAAVHHNSCCLELAKGLSDQTLIGQSLMNLGISHSMATAYDQAERFIRQGLAERARSSGTAHAFALGYLALIAGDQGRFADAYRLLDDARPYDSLGRQSHGDRPTLQGPQLVQRGMVEAWQGDWEACQATATTTLAIAERIEGHYIYAMSRTLEGFARFMSSGSHIGLALMQEAVEFLDRHAIHLTMSWNCALFAESLALSGVYPEARALAERALERGVHWDRMGRATALRVLGIAAARGSGDLVTAQGHMGAALQAADEKASPREAALTRYRWAELLCDGVPEQRAQAQALLRQAHATFTAIGMPFYASAVEGLLCGATPEGPR